ncbi:LPXTG cell wall anchor domain-containing protein [Virgibacillus pantothenticus]
MNHDGGATPGKDNDDRDNGNNAGNGSSSNNANGTLIGNTDHNVSETPGSKNDDRSILPNTATNIYNLLFAGVALIVLGVALYMRKRFRAKKAS